MVIKKEHIFEVLIGLYKVDKTSIPSLDITMASRFSFYSFPGYEFLI